MGKKIITVEIAGKQRSKELYIERGKECILVLGQMIEVVLVGNGVYKLKEVQEWEG